MSFFSKLARGAATGLSNYYSKVADEQEDERKSQVLMAREQALAQINANNRMAEIGETARQQRLTDDHATENNVAEKKALLPDELKAEQAKVAAQEEAKYQSWRKQWLEQFPAETRAKMDEAKMREEYATRRTQIEQAGANARNDKTVQATYDTHPILTGEAPDGSLVASFANGAHVRQTTMQGGRAVRRNSSSDDDLDLGGGGGTSGGGTRRPAASMPSATQTDLSMGAIPGQTRGGGKEYWNGQVWIPVTPGNKSEQQRLLNGG